MILLNGSPLNVTMFPDKTSQVWHLPEETLKNSNWVHVTWTFENEGEFMHLAQLKTLIDAYNFNSKLTIKTLPYARQDKEVGNNTTFALYTFAHLLNSLYFDEIEINDPHSLKAIELIHKSKAVYPFAALTKAMAYTGTNLVCYPDKGALSKYSKVYAHLIGTNYIHGEKVRDQRTGNITSYQLVGDPKGKTVLLVDDLVDGGMTFKILAKDLLAAGAKEVNLFASHGIFSKGLQTLKDSGIYQIFTSDGEATEHMDEHDVIKIHYRKL